MVRRNAGVEAGGIGRRAVRERPLDPWLPTRWRTKVRSETRRGLIRLGLRAGEWAAFLAPVAGLLVFWLLPFKPAVTLYVLIAGLGIVLLKVVELRRLALEI